MNVPLFSIIIVSYNAGSLMKKTIDSVIGQSFRDYEVIVKDGKSTDDTLSYIPNDERIRVVSEKDNGIYNAMNTATQLSKAKYLIYMNCGDVFYDDKVLEKISAAAVKENSADIIYGNYVRNEVLFKQPSIITRFYLYRTPMCHQTLFFKGDILRERYQYNEKYRILADYELEQRMMCTQAVTEYVDTVVCTYLGGGVSESREQQQLKKAEYKEIQGKYYSKFERNMYKARLFLSFRGLRQKLVRDSTPDVIRKLYRKAVNIVNR